MKIVRDIIEIDEEKCNGCGLCILSCAEGALTIVDGKAKVIREPLCDGLGACLSACPMDALKIVQRESEAFDENVVHEHLEALKRKAKDCEQPQILPSGLGNWPVQLRLIPPTAPFLKNADILVLADCVATAYPGLHQDLVPGKAVIMTCPKLDEREESITRLSAIFKEAKIRSITLAIMEVPCCAGLEGIVKEALKGAGLDIPIHTTIIGRNGMKMTGKAPLRPML